MAQQTTTAAGSGNRKQGDRLQQLPMGRHPAFWACAAVRDDQKVQELMHFSDHEMHKFDLPIGTLTAITSTVHPLQQERNESYRYAQKEGVLLFAWEGSQALAEAAA